MSNSRKQQVRIKYLGLAKTVVGKSQEDVFVSPEGSVREVFRLLTQRHGEGFQASMMNSKGALHSFVKVLVGGEDIACGDGLDTVLAVQDEMVIIFTVAPIAGG